MALASTDTTSLLEILEGSFGHVDLDITSSVSTDIPNQEPIAIEESTEISPEKCMPQSLKHGPGLFVL